MPDLSAQMLDAFGRRKACRTPVAFDAQLRLTDLSKVTIRVIDISTHGFKVMSRTRLRVSDMVYLHIPTLGALHAIVRWTSPDISGFEFVQPLYGPVADHIARQYPGHFQSRY